MEKKLYVISLGCTKNLVDTEVMLGRLQNFSMCDTPEDADVIIVNTCGFIDAAKEESIQTVLNLHQTRKKESLLVMAGCLSERYKEELQKELIEVDIFTGVGDYNKIDRLIAEKKSSFSSKPYLIKEEKRVVTGSSWHAFVKLSEGCNQTCSFCAIPSFKGKLQSRDVNLVKKEVERLTNEDFYDFSFISQDSSSYLRDFGIKEGLITLIDKIEEIEGVKSARILYLYPSTTSLKLIEKISSSKIFHNYFEMPIQHISEKMLKIMKRGVGAEKTKELLYAMKDLPGSFIRTGVIVGHPSESEKDFEELCIFLEEFGFDRVNVFAYSDEEGTQSFEMSEKIPPETIEKRVEIIEDIVAKTTLESLKKEVGKRVKVIVEGPSEESEMLIGARKLEWAPDIDGEILINESEIEGLEAGKIYTAEITEVAADKLLGKIIDVKQ
ncbi:30S ribosomal protein S12 methylthiotransferase RimO [Nitrosophilus alvini]|uniref:30S ribosomal protein S12 methylthiotransferase RimO n=1 Tax=Nitrosophilus alvini TaxID=2714855 RepID=UPI00190DE856|nr:30S ribosomal protein S12 methylthiotransferase RimO [Nitrosophilus alvini]